MPSLRDIAFLACKIARITCIDTAVHFTFVRLFRLCGKTKKDVFPTLWLVKEVSMTALEAVEVDCL